MVKNIIRCAKLINHSALCFHTLRFMKLQQIYRRIWFFAKTPKIDSSPAPKITIKRGIFKPPARRQSSLLNGETFSFLNHRGSLSDLGWGNSGKSDSVSKLWRYNQHYFDDLNAFDSSERHKWHLELLQRWVAENPPNSPIAWDPYPISLRIVNWIKWHLTGNTLPECCVESLAIQARWLVQRLEWHILGNHLFSNAKSLVFIGTFFSGDEAEQWLHIGLKIITDELHEQVLFDGGNYERSPMYHAIFLEDLLDLINLSQTFVGIISTDEEERWRQTAQLMLHWFKGMIHPDGEVSFFNDSAIGIAPSPAELLAYASRLDLDVSFAGSRVVHFKESGYVRLSSLHALALLDVAPVGPNYQPGHAHADTLSFELSLFGQRVFVNGGTSEYGTGAVRQVERSTQAHNTVVLNGENSSEVWGGFRVGRRAFPHSLVVEDTSESVFVSCSHDGYLRLPGKPIHSRTWEFSAMELIVFDEVKGNFDDAYAYFHLHPSITVLARTRAIWLLKLPHGQQAQVSIDTGYSSLSESNYSPEFGKRLETLCLKVALIEGIARVRIKWGYLG